MLIIAAAIMLAEAAFYADPDKLHEIDRTFVCPENLPSPKARIDAIAKFDAALNRAVLNLTLERLGEIRMYLLRKHHCYATLENIRRNATE